MKKLIRQWLMAAVPLLLIGTAGCSDDTTQDPVVPTITIGQVSPTSSSVSFRLTPTDATRYTYSVGLNTADLSGTDTAVESAEPSTITVDNLQAETEYKIVAIAYAGNISSEAKTYEFTTLSADVPVIPTIAIGDVTVTHKSAEFTLTTTNATSLSYRYGIEGGEMGQWETVEGSDPYQVTLNDLTAETDYRIEANATGTEGTSETVNKTFRTSAVPAPLDIQFVATASAVLMKFTMNDELISGYYYHFHDTTNDYDTASTLDEFITGLTENTSWFTLQTSSSSTTQSWLNPNTEYKLFAVEVDMEGAIDLSTAVELSATTKTMNVLESSSATVEISDVVPDMLSASMKLSPSANTCMFISQAVAKSNLGGSTIKGYVNMNIDMFTVAPIEGDSVIVFQGLSPETEYWLISVGIDNEGNYGQLTSTEISTTAVSYTDDVTVDLELTNAGYTEATFNVTFNGCTKFKYRHISAQDFQNFYGGDDEQIWLQLYAPYAEEVSWEGEWTLSWLTFGAAYKLFVLPVTESGAFGKPEIIDFSLQRFEATGSSTVGIEVIGIDYTLDFPEAQVRITPGPDCASFIYMGVDKDTYDENSAKLGDLILSYGSYSYTTIDPAVETDAYVPLYFVDTYLCVIPRDSEGRWSAVQVSELLPFNSDGSGDGGGEGGETTDPNEVDASLIDPTAVQLQFTSYLFDKDSFYEDYSGTGYDNSVYRGEITLNDGYSAWYYFVETNSYDWIANNEIGPDKEYATLAQYIKQFGTQVFQSGAIAVRGEYSIDYRMLVLPVDPDGNHSSERVIVSEPLLWFDIPSEPLDDGIAVSPR